jgi:ABC-2 type transport system ATP-binding protein
LRIEDIKMDDAIILERISKQLGGREILKNVSFAVKHGDIFGYLGPNGAGKTTTIRILLGLMQASSGKASILGQDVNADDTRKKVGFVLEADGLYENMSAYENMAYYAQIYGASQPTEVIERVLGLVGLSDRAGDKVGIYSKGMRQRLALARAMVHAPDILIVDEPTAGVDPSGQIEVRQIILDMAHKEGKTVFLSSHNLDEVQRICNRIALIDNGEIKLYGELDELQRKMGKGEVVVETTEAIAEPILVELQSLPEVSIHDRKDRTLILSVGKSSNVSDIVTFLTQRGVRIEQVKRREASLEEIYTTILMEAEQQ